LLEYSTSAPAHREYIFGRACGPLDPSSTRSPTGLTSTSPPWDEPDLRLTIQETSFRGSASSAAAGAANRAPRARRELATLNCRSRRISPCARASSSPERAPRPSWPHRRAHGLHTTATSSTVVAGDGAQATARACRCRSWMIDVDHFNLQRPPLPPRWRPACRRFSKILEPGRRAHDVVARYAAGFASSCRRGKAAARDSASASSAQVAAFPFEISTRRPSGPPDYLGRVASFPHAAPPSMSLARPTGAAVPAPRRPQHRPHRRAISGRSRVPVEDIAVLGAGCVVHGARTMQS